MEAQRDKGSDEQGPVAGSFLFATFIAWRGFTSGYVLWKLVQLDTNGVVR